MNSQSEIRICVYQVSEISDSSNNLSCEEIDKEEKEILMYKTDLHKSAYFIVDFKLVCERSMNMTPLLIFKYNLILLQCSRVRNLLFIRSFIFYTCLIQLKVTGGGANPSCH